MDKSTETLKKVFRKSDSKIVKPFESSLQVFQSQTPAIVSTIDELVEIISDIDDSKNYC